MPPSIGTQPPGLARRITVAAMAIMTIAVSGAHFKVTKQTPTAAIQNEKIFEVKSSSGAGLHITGSGNLIGSGTIVSERTTDLGWSVVAGANAACNATCTHACVFGVNTAATEADIVSCTDTTADECMCAGPN